ncbi:MAG TPA: flippase, partial [Candidatus Dormibacteraeota bacterium]|nr:flippase [Candidatus Dormibacteraeota bacterium]
IAVLSNLASITGDLGLQVIYLREGSRSRPQLERYLAVVLGAKIPLLALSGGTLVLLMAADGHHLLRFAVPAFALLVATAVANVLRSTFYATGEIRYEGMATVAEAVILLGGTAIVAALSLGLSAYLVVYAASYLFTCVFAAVVIRRRYFPLRATFDGVTARRLLRLGLPFALAFFLNTVYFRIDVVILGAMRGLQEVGYYGAGYKFLDGIAFIPQTIMNVLFPSMAVLHTQGPALLRRAYTDAFRLLAAVAMPLAVALGLEAGAVVRLTGVYPRSAAVVGILALAVVFLFVNNSFIFGLGAMDRQLASVGLALGSIVVNVGLNLWLIPRVARSDGYLASSWATVLTEVFLLAAGYLVVRRYLGTLPWGRPLPPILAAGAVMAAVVLLLQPMTVLAVLPVAGVAYVSTLVLTGGVRAEELGMLRAMWRRDRTGRRG